MTALSPVPGSAREEPLEEADTWRPAFAAWAPTLKSVIVNAALDGLISTREAEDLIQEYGLMEV